MSARNAMADRLALILIDAGLLPEMDDDERSSFADEIFGEEAPDGGGALRLLCAWEEGADARGFLLFSGDDGRWFSRWNTALAREGLRVLRVLPPESASSVHTYRAVVFDQARAAATASNDADRENARELLRELEDDEDELDLDVPPWALYHLAHHLDVALARDDAARRVYCLGGWGVSNGDRYDAFALMAPSVAEALQGMGATLVSARDQSERPFSWATRAS